MPPSHLASRAVLVVLVVALASAFVLSATDVTTWQRLNDAAQDLWATLRGAVQGTA